MTAATQTTTNTPIHVAMTIGITGFAGLVAAGASTFERQAATTQLQQVLSSSESCLRLGFAAACCVYTTWIMRDKPLALKAPISAALARRLDSSTLQYSSALSEPCPSGMPAELGTRRDPRSGKRLRTSRGTLPTSGKIFRHKAAWRQPNDPRNARAKLEACMRNEGAALRCRSR